MMLHKANTKTQETRLEICKSCNSYAIGICKKCGCFMLAKVHFVDSVCPINKW
ncbi:hypothetical protein UFOVP746_54 [uncultured Caudovirales phage]|jgi:hypothetical protein|uniref:Uncharacterized protein n=1 Tax=uncultured Caudovirales phage TaxID=2100421 RepID=A0A6J7X3Z9_9CAUD|nr:hypothetical protein UFOVP746_54 [uncultured Caudovirales phage]